MRSFLRTFLPLVLVLVLGLAAAPVHTGTAEHLTQAGHTLHEDGHCASHHSHGHVTMAECLQGGHSLSLSLCAPGSLHTVLQRGTWHASHDESGKPAPSEASTPPPRSA
jgi:hypothetical protein